MSDGEKELMSKMGEVELKVDAIHTATHISSQLHSRASLHLDSFFSTLSLHLAMRNKPGASSKSTGAAATHQMLTAGSDPSRTSSRLQPSDPLDVLRALSRTTSGPKLASGLGKSKDAGPGGGASSSSGTGTGMSDAARRAARDVKEAVATAKNDGGIAGKLSMVNPPTPRKPPGTPRRSGNTPGPGNAKRV